MESQELIQRIDIALTRMEARGDGNTIHFDRLKAKRDAIASQAYPYAVYQVESYVIGALGAAIPSINRRCSNGECINTLAQRHKSREER